MSLSPKPLHQLTQEAGSFAVRSNAILSREIGIANTIRFLNQFSPGYGNYTEEREALFKDLTLDEVLQRMRER